jgi:membrane protease YdiL (CAAX protease family)
LLALIAFLAMVGVFLIVLASSGGVAEIAPTVERFGATPLLALGGLALALVLSSGPLLEEMGWRGFALPMLLTRFTPLLASVILGVLWAAWHLPREIGPLMSGADGVWTAFLFKQMNFFPGCIATSVIATFLYFKLGGSVWGGVLAHAFHNEMSVNVMRVAVPDIMIGAFPLGMLTLIEIAIAVGLIILTRGNLGADKDYRQEPHPFAR